MKKAIKLLSLLLCLVMAFSLVACGGDNTSSSKDDDDDDKDVSSTASVTASDASSTESTTESSTNSTTESATQSTEQTTSQPSGNYAVLEDLVESTIPSLEDTVKQYEQQGIKLSLRADGYKLVYTCKFMNELPKEDEAKDTLVEQLNSEQFVQQYQGIYNAVKTEAPLIEAVTVEYVTVDGRILASKDYR